jgi:glycosyltransferase involved in cell wall biosynthesis
MELAKNKKLEKVIFKGKLSHSSVIDEMRKADCFIMISENEVFGLVYLEAMSQGCITIASKGEGIDGIIQDKKNGFLCKAGNVDDLIKVLQYIRNMSRTDLDSMRKKAFLTARQYNESSVAEKYLENVINNAT